MQIDREEIEMNGNGNARLYRSTTDVAMGGVAAGLGDYFKVDPTLIRLGFVLATVITGGIFIAVYLALWMLIPAAGSTLTEPGKIINENLNDMGSRVRSFAAGTPTQRMGDANANVNPSGAGTEPMAMQDPSQTPPASASAQARSGLNPRVLILIGAFFLLVNMGAFRAFHGAHWGTWWPLILVGIGVIMLARRK
jgi:phage shock protein PspC (stress-responsive transcriptional regulator)